MWLAFGAKYCKLNPNLSGLQDFACLPHRSGSERKCFDTLSARRVPLGGWVDGLGGWMGWGGAFQTGKLGFTTQVRAGK